MLSLTRRTAMAKRQAVRRAAKHRAIEEWERKKEARRATAKTVGEAIYSIKQARIARREDWEMGPLAPNRDHGLHPPGRIPYGTISFERLRQELHLSHEAREARCAWAGGLKFLCIEKGDRAVVMEGPYKGKIGTISAIHKASCTVEMQGVVKVNAATPGFMLGAKVDGEGLDPVVPLEDHVPISAIRLVHPVEDRATGATRDVIIKQLFPVRKFYDRPTRTTVWERMVPGLNIVIPWPAESDPEHEDHACDTLRIEVEERTFVPTLLRPPVPEAVIDELRNKFSKFRTRHTPEFVAQIDAAVAEKRARARSVDTMMTPLQEFNRQQRRLRKARGQPVLTDEMLEKIGRVIASNKKLALDGAGISMAGDDGLGSPVAETTVSASSETAIPDAESGRTPENTSPPAQ